MLLLNVITCFIIIKLMNYLVYVYILSFILNQNIVYLAINIRVERARVHFILCYINYLYINYEVSYLFKV